MRISNGVVAVVLVGAITGLRADEASRPDLSGPWRLDPAQSEDARAKLRELRGDRGDRPRGGGRMGGGGGGRPPGGGLGGGRGGPGGGRPEGMREGLGELLDAPPALTVTQTATEITVLEEDGRLRALHPDGRAYKDSLGREVKTRWSAAGELVTETKGGRGKMVETFAVSKDPARLSVTLLLDLRGQPIAIRRVYLRPEAAPAAPMTGELPPPAPPVRP
jgi:hypothetical protein